MTDPVELERLVAVAEGFGTVPMLLTVDATGRPRATAVTLTWDGAAGQRALVAVGHRSLTNAQDRPGVALLWPAPPGQRFALLADATVTSAVPDPQPATSASGDATPEQPDVQPAPAGADPTPEAASSRHRRVKQGGTLTLEIEKAILHQVSA